MVDFFAKFCWHESVSCIFILFAAIDVVGNTVVIINFSKKIGHIESEKSALVAFGVMTGFFFFGEVLLKLFSIPMSTFGLAGSITLFLFGFELVTDIKIFQSLHDEEKLATTSITSLIFPLLIGPGTLTTLLAMKAEHQDINIFISIVVNSLILYLVFKYVKWFEKVLGPIIAEIMRKVMGVILLALAINIMLINIKKIC